MNSMKRLWRAIERFLESPPKRALGIVVVVLTCIFLSGGLFCIIMNMPGVIVTPRGFVFIYPGVEYQTGAEAFVVFMLLILGAAGLLMIYYGANKPQDKRRSLMYMLMGLIFITLSVFVLIWMLYLKVLL